MEIPKTPKILLVITGLICYTQTVFGQQVIKSPHGKLTIDIDCSACHRPNSWKPAKAKMNFDHKKMTGFALIGKHKMISCQSCHLDLRFDKPQVIPGNCGSCHVDVHQGKFGTNCISCHNQNSFHHVKGLAIHAKTGFPLTGAHQQLACQSCHQNDRNGAFTNLDTDCYSCHKKDYETAQSIDHVKQGFSTQCQQCHNTMGWGGAAFDHVTVSGGFALVGAHKQIRCESCHVVPSFANKFHTTNDQDCYSCHQSNFQEAHGGSNFPHTCLYCHNENSWGGAEFDHAKISNGFELLGSHKKLECSSCHVIPSYQNKFQATNDQDCYSCHQTDFQKAHSGSNFPTTCATCHNVNTWDDAQFDHAKVSNGFQLLGAHKTINCSGCHVIPSYKPKFDATSDQDCYSCHQSNYQTAHGAGSGISTTCTDCHNVNTWGNVDFQQHDQQYFPIYSGAHKGIWESCQTCHTTKGNYASFSCLNCHAHAKTTMDQKHSEVSGYSYVSTACYSCHPNGHSGD